MSGNTSHYVLAGLAIPISKWKVCEKGIDNLKAKYGLQTAEIHTAWISRMYLEQTKIPNFENLPKAQRILEVERYRKQVMLTLQRNPTSRTKFKQVKKNFQKTQPYIHLTYAERISFLAELADLIGSWKFAKIFGKFRK